MRTVAMEKVDGWRPQFAVWNMADGTEALKEKLGDTFDRMGAILATAEEEDRDLTAAEISEYDGLKTQYDATQARIHRQTQFHAISETMRPGRRSTPEGPNADLYGGSVSRRDDGYGALDRAARARMQLQPYEGRRFVDLFGHAERSNFKSPEEFFSIIARNMYDPRLIMDAAMSEGENVGGGFFVPVQFARDILDRALEQSVMWGRVRVEPMTSNALSISSFGNTDHSTGKPYGLMPEWKGEAQTFTEQAARVRAIHLRAQKCGILVPFSVELSEDAPNFAASLQSAVSEAIAWGIDDTILSGNGVGQPLGILNGPSTVSVAKETGQAADTINFYNVSKMFGRLHPQSVTSAVWLANPNTLPQLLTMIIPVKNVAGTENVGGSWYPALTNESGVYSLLGRPLVLTEKAPTLGDKGDIMLVDPRQYVVGLRRNMTASIDPYSKFASDQIQLKVTCRLAGQPIQDVAFTPKNGPATLAPFVVLDERS